MQYTVVFAVEICHVLLYFLYSFGWKNFEVTLFGLFLDSDDPASVLRVADQFQIYSL